MADPCPWQTKARERCARSKSPGAGLELLPTPLPGVRDTQPLGQVRGGQVCVCPADLCGLGPALALWALPFQAGQLVPRAWGTTIIGQMVEASRCEAGGRGALSAQLWGVVSLAVWVLPRCWCHLDPAARPQEPSLGLEFTLSQDRAGWWETHPDTILWDKECLVSVNVLLLPRWGHTCHLLPPSRGHC